jgi:hypothetical protein
VLRRIVALGVELVTLQDGRRYTAAALESDFGALVLPLVTAQRAHEESRTKSTRVGAAWAKKRERAAAERKPLGAICPSWLRLDGGRYVVIPERARIVRRIFELAVEGYGQEAIAKRLNRERVPGIGRVPTWNASTVSQYLRSIAVIGRYQPHRLVTVPKRKRVPDGDVIENYFPPIVPVALFLRVREQRAKRQLPGGPRNPAVPNLFAGLARCDCGAPTWFVDKGPNRLGKPRLYLTCSATKRGVGKCHSRPRPYEATERAVLSLVAERIPWDDLVPRAKTLMETALAGVQEKAATLSIERADVATRLANIVAMVETGNPSTALPRRLAELERKAAELADEWESVENNIEAIQAGLATTRPTAERQRRALDDWNTKGRQDGRARQRLAVVLRELLSRVVLPADRTFPPVLHFTT